MGGRRVVFLDQRADIAGAQVVLLELLRLAVDAGWKVALAIPVGGALESRVRKDFGESVAIHAIELPRVTSGWKSPRDLWRLAASAVAMRFPPAVLQADLVHVNGPRIYPAWWWANRRLRIPTLYHVHLLHSTLERWFIRSALLGDPVSRVLANSPMVWRGLGGATAKHLVLVENALPLAMGALGFEDRWDDSPLRCAVIGALMPEKGHRLVLEAARSLPHVEFHLAGADIEGHADYARSLGRDASANVRFHGGVTDVRAWISATRAQCAVVPSARAESFGLVAVESMACSCLTLVADRGALSEIASETGARVFADSTELVAQLRDVAGRGQDAGRAEARTQYDRVNVRFAPERFRREMRAQFDERLASRAP